MGSLSLPQSGQLYLDASIIIYSIEKIEPYWGLLQPLWRAAQTGQFSLVGSELLLLETLIAPVRAGDEHLEEAFRTLLSHSREIRLLPISRPILDIAIRLRAESGLKSPDAIHAATALYSGCNVLLTNDPAFKRVTGIETTVLKDFL